MWTKASASSTLPLAACRLHSHPHHMQGTTCGLPWLSAAFKCQAHMHFGHIVAPIMGITRFVVSHRYRCDRGAGVQQGCNRWYSRGTAGAYPRVSRGTAGIQPGVQYAECCSASICTTSTPCMQIGVSMLQQHRHQLRVQLLAKAVAQAIVNSRPLYVINIHRRHEWLQIMYCM